MADGLIAHPVLWAALVRSATVPAGPGMRACVGGWRHRPYQRRHARSLSDYVPLCATLAPTRSSPPSSVDVIANPNFAHQPTENELDFALVRVQGRPGEERVHGVPRGWIQVVESPLPLQVGTPLLIVQHPNGEPMQLAIDTDGILAISSNGTRVRYTTNTRPGSSGSPCFGMNWTLVALHHSGDPAIVATYNEGIPIGKIRAHLHSKGLLGSLGGTPPTAAPESLLPETPSAPVSSPQPDGWQPEKPTKPLRVVCLFAPEDKKFFELLQRHLVPMVKQGLIEIWSEQDIRAGNVRSVEIGRAWDAAELLVMLVSADLFASCADLVDLAVERQRAGQLELLPVVVRPVGWRHLPIAHFEPIPKSGKPINTESDWMQVQDAIDQIIDKKPRPA